MSSQALVAVANEPIEGVVAFLNNPGIDPLDMAARELSVADRPVIAVDQIGFVQDVGLRP